MNIKHRDIKNNFHLSNRQKDVLIGTLLGDGNLTKHGQNFRLFIKHSESQSVLAKWKRKEFDNITMMKLNFFQQEVKGKVYRFCQFVTLTHSEFAEYRKIFYPNKKKVISRKIKKIFNSPLSLAVWIMDDGAKDNVGMTLQTHSFSLSGIKILQKCLKDNFGILTNTRKNRSKNIIYIPKSEIKKLYNLVKNYLLPEYKYKFPL